MDGLQQIDTLHRAHQIASDTFYAAMREIDVTPRQATVLRAIGNMASCSQTDLVDATGIDRSTLSDICRRLKRKGWVNRPRDRGDLRAYSLALTAEGTSVHRGVERASRAIGVALAKRLSGLDRLQVLAPVREAAE